MVFVFMIPITSQTHESRRLMAALNAAFNGGTGVPASSVACER